MPRYKRTNREAALGETRRRLLEAAGEEFARNGYDSANVNRISLAAGFAKGTVYNYFPSKQALLLALIDEIAHLHFDFIAEPVHREPDPRRRLERFFEVGISFVQHYPAQARLITSTLYGADDTLKQRIYQSYLPFFELIGMEILQPGIAQGLYYTANIPATTSLIMITYLGCCAQMNTEANAGGKVWLDSGLVADFVLRALRPAEQAR